MPEKELAAFELLAATLDLAATLPRDDAYRILREAVEGTEEGELRDWFVRNIAEMFDLTPSA
jgi:hypothetical protein